MIMCSSIFQEVFAVYKVTLFPYFDFILYRISRDIPSTIYIEFILSRNFQGRAQVSLRDDSKSLKIIV